LSTTDPIVREENLDPNNWNEMRALGHQMIDDMMAYTETIRERPIWQPMPSELEAEFKKPLPHAPQAPEDIYEEFLKLVPDYNMGSVHPRFWGWVIGSGTPLGALADMLAAMMNPNLGGGNHVANRIESQVVDWCKQMLGYDAAASGLLVSGGSMANLVGLTVARNKMAKHDMRAEGLQGDQSYMTIYASEETHSSIHKGVEVLGLGRNALRLLPVDENFELKIDALEEAIADDKAAGHHPFCVVGNAGTVNTGAFDDLNKLAEICKRENMWFHVDGAFGAIAAISPKLKPLTAGMEHADSIAFDLHKWMYVPYEAGCALVRDRDAHYDVATYTPDYLSHGTRGVHSGDTWFSDYGIQLSRGFKALKVWMSFKEHGIEKYARVIEKNVEQAQYLENLVNDTPELIAMAPTPLMIGCFRFIKDGFDQEQLNQLNEEILIRLHEEGIAIPSYTMIDGCYVIRVSICNHRTERSDLELLVKEVVRLGNELSS